MYCEQVQNIIRYQNNVKKCLKWRSSSKNNGKYKTIEQSTEILSKNIREGFKFVEIVKFNLRF